MIKCAYKAKMIATHKMVAIEHNLANEKIEKNNFVKQITEHTVCYHPY